ncbi:MAG TPA: hypothetical protein VE685_14405, partial [Thermoanaerobaculia bacterium]|nr:hypothetical protein [Thermoanaerobaculia bacterium]
MVVTRSTAAERRQRQTTVTAVPGLRPGPVPRRREALLLSGGLAVVLLGLLLVYLAVTRPLADVPAKLASGEIQNLNALDSSEKLLPLLDFYDSAEERTFVAETIWRRLHESPAPNVGELAKIRVPASEIGANRQLTGLR